MDAKGFPWVTEPCGKHETSSSVRRLSTASHTNTFKATGLQFQSFYLQQNKSASLLKMMSTSMSWTLCEPIRTMRPRNMCLGQRQSSINAVSCVILLGFCLNSPLALWYQTKSTNRFMSGWTDPSYCSEAHFHHCVCNVIFFVENLHLELWDVQLLPFRGQVLGYVKKKKKKMKNRTKMLSRCFRDKALQQTSVSRNI